MTDHAPDATREELVRAYVDGDLDEAGRAQVEADPDLRAEVAAQREVRSALTAEPPSGSAREQAIAAALAAFDARPTTARAPAPVSLQARRRARWMTPAAAAIAVVIAGGAIAIVTSGDDGQDAGDQSVVLDEAGGDAVAPGAPAATSEVASATIAIAAEATTARDESADAGAATSEDAIPMLASPAELAAFAAGLRSAPVAPTAGTASEDAPEAASATTDQPLPTTLSSCAPDALALADLVVAGEVRRVVVRVDEARAEAVALDATTCVEVQRVPLP